MKNTKERISKVENEDGKECMVKTTISGNTIINIEECESEPIEFVDNFE